MNTKLLRNQEMFITFLQHMSDKQEPSWMESIINKCKLQVTKKSLRWLDKKFLSVMYKDRDIQVTQTCGASHKRKLQVATPTISSPKKKR